MNFSPSTKSITARHLWDILNSLSSVQCRMIPILSILEIRRDLSKTVCYHYQFYKFQQWFWWVDSTFWTHPFSICTQENINSVILFTCTVNVHIFSGYVTPSYIQYVFLLMTTQLEYSFLLNIIFFNPLKNFIDKKLQCSIFWSQ